MVQIQYTAFFYSYKARNGVETLFFFYKGENEMKNDMFDAIFFLLLAILMSQLKVQWLCVIPMITSAVYYTKYALVAFKKE